MRYGSAVTKTNSMADRFTPKQGQYLAFIYNYTVMNGRAPAEADLERFFRTTYPTIHQMILRLEEKGLISRAPGQARSIKLLVDPGEIPRLFPPKTK
jgi:repressor LexA